MAKITIEDLDANVLEILQARASRHNHSLEVEIKEVLVQFIAKENLPQVAAQLRQLRTQIAWKNPPIRELIEEGRRF